MSVMEKIKKNAEGSEKKIIFPEGEDERVIKAARLSVKNKTAKPILVGDEEVIKKKAEENNISLENIDIINPEKSDKINEYAKIYKKKTGTSLNTSKLIVNKPLFFAALALIDDDADGMIGGTVYTSGEFITVCKEIVGLKKNISVPSSIFIMSIPDYKGGENGCLVYSDASVNPNPTSEELADIAVTSGRTVKSLLDWKPRIAMLSFSTQGSAEHNDVNKVVEATKIAKKKAEDLLIDGEFQADTALIKSTAERKIKEDIGEVAGRANILIFPDLDAGNISYKLTKIVAKAKAYGPILQGFKKPVSDLSRGADAEEIYGALCIVSYWATRWK